MRNTSVENFDDLPSVRDIRLYPGYDQMDHYRKTSDIAILTLRKSIRDGLNID